MGGNGGRGQDGAIGFASIEPDTSNLPTTMKHGMAVLLHQSAYRHVKDISGPKPCQAEVTTSDLASDRCNFKYYVHAACGGAGGNGGTGGRPGRAGHIHLFALRTAPAIVTASQHGEWGAGGIAGMSGTNPHKIQLNFYVEVDYVNGTEAVRGNWTVIGREPDETCAEIIAAIDGRQANATQIEDRGTPAYYHVAINEYQAFARENQLNHLKCDDIARFIRMLHNDSVIYANCTLMDYANELQLLDDQYFRLHRDVDLKSYYESLATRISRFIDRSQAIMTPAQVKVARYVQTAAYGKFVILRRSDQSRIDDVMAFLNRTIDVIERIDTVDRQAVLADQQKGRQNALRRDIEDLRSFMAIDEGDGGTESPAGSGATFNMTLAVDRSMDVLMIHARAIIEAIADLQFDKTLETIDDGGVERLKAFEVETYAMLMNQMRKQTANHWPTEEQLLSSIHSATIALKDITRSLKLPERLLTRIQRLITSLSTLAAIFDRIDDYHNHARLIAYTAAAIVTDQPIDADDLQPTVARLDMIITSNVLLEQYRAAADAFKIAVFPFIERYSDRYNLPSSLQLIDNITELAQVAATHIREFQAILDAQHTIDDDSTITLIEWRAKDHRHAIGDLMAGKRVLLFADIRHAPQLNAITVHAIDLRLRAANGTQQSLIGTLLEHTQVTMTRGGVAHLRCGAAFFAINGPAVNISFSVAKGADGLPLRKCSGYEQLKDDAISPYGWWTIQLHTVADGDGQLMEKMAAVDERVDLVMTGRGRHVETDASVCRGTAVRSFYAVDYDFDGFLI